MSDPLAPSTEEEEEEGEDEEEMAEMIKGVKRDGGELSLAYRPFKTIPGMHTPPVQHLFPLAQH